MFTLLELKQIILVASMNDLGNPTVLPTLRAINKEMLMPSPPVFIRI